MTKTNSASAVATKAARTARPAITDEQKKADAKALAAKLGDAKPQLARGVKAADARQSAKAVADAAAKGKASNKADAVTQKPAASPRAATKLASSAIKVLKRDIDARAESFRYRMLTALLASKTVAEFYAADKETGKSRFDAGCVRFAVNAGYISLT